MKAHFCLTGASFGQSPNGPVTVDQAVHFLCAPDEEGWYLLVLEDAAKELSLLGVFWQMEPSAKWIIQPSTAVSLQTLDGHNDDLLPFRFGTPGQVTVTIMLVTEAVVEEVSQLPFFASCTAADVVRWCRGGVAGSHMVTCVIQPNAEAT